MAIQQWKNPGGEAFTMRLLVPADYDIAREALRRLSPRSRYLRFFIRAWKPNEERLRRAVNPDPERAYGLIVTTTAEGREVAVGAGQFFLAPPDDQAEFAVLLGDEWQRRGIGTRLLNALVDEARARGLRRIFGEVLAGNTAMLTLARKVGFEIAPHPGDRGIRVASLLLAAQDQKR